MLSNKKWMPPSSVGEICECPTLMMSIPMMAGVSLIGKTSTSLTKLSSGDKVMIQRHTSAVSEPVAESIVSSPTFSNAKKSASSRDTHEHAAPVSHNAILVRVVFPVMAFVKKVVKKTHSSSLGNL